MGTNTSKPVNDTSLQIIKTDGETVNSDPRSPTPEIVRTPLHPGKAGVKHNITKNADLRKTLENAPEEKLIHNNPILSAVIKNHLQSYDPRSPTQEFDRTPIVLTSDKDDIPKERLRLRQKMITDCGSPCLKESSVDDLDNSTIQNELPSNIEPKNLCDRFLDITLDNTLIDPIEPLGSSTASQEAIESNNKPTQLLETDFDYVEIDSDGHDTGNASDIDDKSDVIVPTEILEDDPRSPSIGIERTPIVVTKVNDRYTTKVEDLSDDTLIKVLQSTNADFRNTLTKKRSNNNDGLLIYEDETSNFNNVTPRKTIPDSNSGSRTPLSCVKNKTDGTHVRSKSANTLLDSKNNAMQASKRVSHIPRLKSLMSSKPLRYSQAGSLSSLKTSGISGDCENTPPQSHRDIWDKDNSIVL